MARVMASKSHPCLTAFNAAMSMAALVALSESAYLGLLLPRVDACIKAAHPRRHAVSASPRLDAARASASSSRLGRQMLVHGAAAPSAFIAGSSSSRARTPCGGRPRRSASSIALAATKLSPSNRNDHQGEYSHRE